VNELEVIIEPSHIHRGKPETLHLNLWNRLPTSLYNLQMDLRLGANLLNLGTDRIQFNQVPPGKECNIRIAIQGQRSGKALLYIENISARTAGHTRRFPSKAFEINILEHKEAMKNYLHLVCEPENLEINELGKIRLHLQNIGDDTLENIELTLRSKHLTFENDMSQHKLPQLKPGQNRLFEIWVRPHQGGKIKLEASLSAEVRGERIQNNYAFEHVVRSLLYGQQKSLPNVQQDILLIVTVTKVEARAVLDIFFGDSGTSWERHQIEEKTYYNLGFIGGVPVYMVQSEMGSGTPSGSIVTVLRAIKDLNPQAVIMCGIAFGLQKDKQKLGDILISQKLEYYESQKVDYQKGQISRGDRITASARLLDRFRAGDIDWGGAKTHFGLFLSGEKLVNDPIFRDSLKKMEPEAIGGDMEGSGLYTAARDAGVEWIVVKAICDWADGSKNDNAQSMAAHNAAQFVLHVVKLGGWL
jgi:nucleoside phosphorylase